MSATWDSSTPLQLRCDMPDWLALWHETAAEIFAPAAAAQLSAKAGRIAESLKLGLFFRPELPLRRPG